MSVVVIGGDSLGSIEKNLYALGATELIHVTGRKKMDRKKCCIPNRAAFIIVLTDFVNHGTAAMVKDAAKSLNIPMIFAKRSWSSVAEKIRTGGVFNV